MKVEQHLRQLLFRYDCVVLPGFGAFLLRYRPACYSEAEHLFFPPSRQLSFNAQLTETDALLANEIAAVEKVNFNQAERRVEQFVQQLKLHLNRNERIEIKGLGDFKTVEQQLVFTPQADQNFLLNAFGLNRFSGRPVERLEAKQVKTEEQQDNGTLEPNPTSHERVTASTDQKRAVYPYLKYAAVGILAIGLSGFLGLNWYSDSVKEHNMQAQKEAEQAVENKIQQATFSIQNPMPEVKLNVTRQKGKYHIIAGAFRSSKNAQQQVKSLRKAGYKSREIGVNKYGLHQVTYGSFDDRLEALQELRNIKRTENSSAWLFVKQL